MVKPATGKEISARSADIWACEEYSEIKTRHLQHTSSLLNVLSLWFHHCTSELSKSSRTLLPS